MAPVPAPAAVVAVKGCVHAFPVAACHLYTVDHVHTAAAFAVCAELAAGTGRAAGTAVGFIGLQVSTFVVARHVPGPAGTGAVPAGPADLIADRPAGTAVEVVFLQVSTGKAAVRMPREAAVDRTFIGNGEVAVLVGDVGAVITPRRQDEENDKQDTGSRQQGFHDKDLPVSGILWKE
jgi:hypothetical protein